MPHDDENLIETLRGVGPVNHVATTPAHPLLQDRHVVHGGAVQEGTIGEVDILSIDLQLYENCKGVGSVLEVHD